MDDLKEFLGIILVITGVFFYFAATDYFGGEVQLRNEVTAFDYRFSKIDPIVHKIFVDIEGEREVKAILTGKDTPEGTLVFEYNGRDIHTVKEAYRGEVWSLKISNPNSGSTRIEYKARITCYSYVYVGIFLFIVGAILYLKETLPLRRSR
ncbi:MAG: hypothetical protein ACE5PM_00145 [Candidatus Hydrothermarchaeales archaeon]